MTAGRRMAAAWLAGAALAAADAPSDRRIPFWPDAVPAAIRAEVDGVAILETVRELSRFHRVQGSPGFAAAAEHVRVKAAHAGLSDASIEHFPADGQTRYAHFRSYLGWEAHVGVLEEVRPRSKVVARFPELSVALADYSQDADVEAELVDVRAGVAEADYAGKEVRGRIVLASGALPTVHRRACLERGAVGFLSDFPNQRTAWSGDDRDLVRWGHLSPYETRNRFAFMVSPRQSAELRARLAAGEPIVLRARVRARMRPATYDVVTATIPGGDATAGEVILTAHLCHQSAGANDNASGSAAILEVGRALAAAVRRGTLSPPRRTIRFLWAPEIAGTHAWLVRHPELAGRLTAGIHMDMVGGLLSTIRGTFHLSRSAESLPHGVSDVARTWLDHVVRASAAHAEGETDAHAGLVWPPGSRETFLGDFRPLETGSDHQVLQAFGVPTVYFHDWPDVTIHTNKDQPENLDATKLGRVAYMGAGIAWTMAALPPAEVPRLLAVVRAGAEERLARAELRAELASDGADGGVIRREAIDMGIAAVRSVARAWPSIADAAREAERRLDARRLAVSVLPAGRDARVPRRTAEVRGPLDVYYYDHLREVLGADADTASRLIRRPRGDVLAYEALNLVDGVRSVAEIRDVLTGRYETVPVEEVGEYFDLLARASAIQWKEGRR